MYEKSQFPQRKESSKPFRCSGKKSTGIKHFITSRNTTIFQRTSSRQAVDSTHEAWNGTSNFQHLFSPGIPFWQRVTRLLILICCIVLCVYQVYDRGSLYLNEPTSVDVLLFRNETITFPAVTFCSTLRRFLNGIAHNMLQKLGDKKDYTLGDMWNVSFEEHGFDVDQMWKDAAMSASSITANVKARMSTSYIGVKFPFPGLITNVDTAYCRCVTFTPETSLELKGRTFTNIDVDQVYVLQPHNISQNDTDLYFKFHDVGIDQTHESMGYEDTITQKRQLSRSLIIKKYAYQKKKRFHCEDQLRAHDKVKRCIDGVLSKAMILCRYPFVGFRKAVRPCTTLKEIFDSAKHIYNIYDEPDIINCHKKRQICSETVYKMFPIPEDKLEMPESDYDKSRYSRLTVVIEDNKFETAIERFTYSFAALLSDVGGSLGFFLGMSLMTLFDAMQGLIPKFTRLCK